MAAVGPSVPLGIAVNAPTPLRYPPPPLPPPLPPSPPPVPDFSGEELPSSSELIQGITTADDFDQSRYAMKPESYARILPYLETLVPKAQPEPRKDKKTDKKEEEEGSVERFGHIKDAKFLQEVNNFTDQFKSTEGASRKKDAIQKAAKEFWNSHLGKKIDYDDLKTVLGAVVTT